MTDRLSLRFRNLKDGEVQPLEKTPNLPAGFHRWSQAEIDALTLALAANRPLLIRGEPGIGKTQIARAAADHLGWRLESVTIHSRYEPQDLQYRFDAVRRLADASSSAQTSAELDARKEEYWEPGPLWKAFGWDTAQRYGSCRPRKDQPVEEPKGFVVLIDEIDKADADLPNALLEVLGQRSFPIPGLGLQVGEAGRQQPLVLITTNEERELPAAFLRRCLVLNLEVGPEGYRNWLVQRGAAHFGAIDQSNAQRAARLTPAVLERAADQLVADRLAAQEQGLPPPGAAEYLDLLQALDELAPGDSPGQLCWLDELSRYAFVKNGAVDGVAELSQRRDPVPKGPA